MSDGEKVFRINPRRSGSLELALGLVAVAPLAMALLFARQWGELGKLFRRPEVWLLLLFCVAALLFWYWHRRRFGRSARLVVSARGLSLRSGLPRFLQAGLQGDWYCGWDEITAVTVVERFGLVTITRAGGVRKPPLGLRVVDWIAEGVEPAAPVPVANMRKTALWQALERAGLFEKVGADPRFDAVTFDLWKHAATRAVLLAAAALVAYGALDAAVLREAWADYSARYYLPHLLAGGLALAASAYALFRSRALRPIPVQIIVVLGLLFGLSAGFASYSAMIRLNQLAGGPLEIKQYKRNATCDALVPVETGLPTIEYSGLAVEYWCQFSADELHEVPVRRGLFGLYQVDLTSHTEAIRRYRAERPPLRRRRDGRAIGSRGR